MTRHFIWLFAALCGSAAAADIALVGVIGDKAAVLAVDGGDPKTVKVGQSWRGISVLAVGSAWRLWVLLRGAAAETPVATHPEPAPVA